MKGWRFAALGFLFAVAGGCVSVVPRPPEADGNLSQPRFLLERVRERRGRFHNLRGLVEITLDSKEEQYSGKAALLLQAGGSIRLEPLNFFGQPLIYIVAHDDQLETYDPGKGDYFRGPATAQNLHRWLGIPVSSREVVRILWGGIPEAEPGTQYTAEWDGRVGTSGSYRFEFSRAGQGTRRWWADAVTYLPIRFQADDAGGNPLLNIRYRGYRKDLEIPLPETVEVEVGQGERTMDLHYGRVQVNRGLAPLAFHLPVPQGTPVIQMDR